MAIVEEEADESLFWFEMLVESRLVNADEVAATVAEANELLAMTVASINTAKEAERRSKVRRART